MVRLPRLSVLLALLPLLGGCFRSHGLGDGEPVGEPPALCELTYTRDRVGAETTCFIARDAAEPCRDTMRCLCEAGLAPESEPRDVDACIGAWLNLRALISLGDFCAWSPDMEARPLSEAVEGFAAAYGDRVASSAVCDETPARARFAP